MLLGKHVICWKLLVVKINKCHPNNEYKSKLIYPYLVILQDEEKVETKLEQSEIDKGFKLEWVNSQVIKDRHNNLGDVMSSSVEVFKRGIAKTIELGLDTISNSNDWQYIFNKQFSMFTPAFWSL